MHGELTRRIGLLAALSLAGIGQGCAGDDTPPPNLLLVTLDTTRADRLGCYGHEDAGTAHLDRLAAEGMVFDQAVAVTTTTLPSHLSLLTGQYPPRHGVRVNGNFLSPDGRTMLAGHLGERGYSTAAVVAAYILSAEFGIGEGFETYDEPRERRASAAGGASLRHQPILDRRAEEVTDTALALLDGGLEEPFFLWVHYYDPHGEYDPPEPFAGRYPDDPYQGEIAYLDSHVGRLFERLREDGSLDRTLVAVTADHGESPGNRNSNGTRNADS